MIAYHGGPITPEKVALSVWRGRHAMVSFAYPDQLPFAASVAESFALDNGAFSEWKAGKQSDWEGFYKWVDDWRRHPGFDFALIPDVIDGREDDNDLLVFNRWPFGKAGVPVWHLHESLNRLEYLAKDWPRIALGSSGKYSRPGAGGWWARIADAMRVVCDEQGRPKVRLHGLRMLNPALSRHIPFASADSTTVARNINLDSRWSGTYSPASKEIRALLLADRLQPCEPAERWSNMHIQDQLLQVFA